MVAIRTVLLVAARLAGGAWFLRVVVGMDAMPALGKRKAAKLELPSLCGVYVG